MNVAFRVDSSPMIGSGHVMRCLTLADALSKLGHEIIFVCKEHESNLIHKIMESGYEVKGLPVMSGNDVSSRLAHAEWLGGSQEEDSEQTIEVLKSYRIDLIVVDHYAIDELWHKKIRPFVKRILVIDDLADRCHECDYLIDQNYGRDYHSYDGLKPEHAKLFTGPEYSLLKPVYAEYRGVKNREINFPLKSILIYFGSGSDAWHYIEVSLMALCDEALLDIEIDVVVPGGEADPQRILELVKSRGKVTLHRNLPDLAGLMFSADLAIGAGGATTWERCCAKLPSLVIAIASNQEPACEALHKNDLIEYLGIGKYVSAEMITNKINSLGIERLTELSERSGSIVSGDGAHLIAKHIHADLVML